jgi:hypothetical protein
MAEDLGTNPARRNLLPKFSPGRNPRTDASHLYHAIILIVTMTEITSRLWLFLLQLVRALGESDPSQLEQ